MCLDNQFRCNDGRCIPSHWKCDSKRDCTDGSDEPESCSENDCSSTHFTCKLSKKCIPKGWVCDEEEDCGVHPDLGADKSDEDPKQCLTTANCIWNQARCGQTGECRPIEKFCDGNRDCPDNSDEMDFCDNNTTCSRLECQYGCKPTLDGPMCFCPEGRKAEGKKCVDADECELDTTCDQICKNTDGSFECSCRSGYKMKDKQCVAINGKIISIDILVYVIVFCSS